MQKRSHCTMAVLHARPPPMTATRPTLTRFALAWVLLCLAMAPGHAEARSDFHVDYTVAFVPADKAADITMVVKPGSGRAKRFRFTMSPERYHDIRGDQVSVDGDTVTWKVPKAGGTLRYRYGPIDHERDPGEFDARMTDTWTILRGDDLFPPAAVVLTKGADSRTRLRFDLPEGWTFVDTGYTRNNADDAFVVTNSRRSFDRPVGWIIAGSAIGSRREMIDGVELAVAAPEGSAIQRNVVLALANWVFPEMRNAFGDMPRKVLLVSADDPMWRGGLSAPNSFYMHSSRPLISENYTSTLIHELVHMATRVSDKRGYDWITEGLAEYYAIELLRRARGMTRDRHDKVLADLADWGQDITTLKARNSTGPRTARAVGWFNALDLEIRAKTDDAANLDDVTRRLMKHRKVDLDDLRDAVEAVAGQGLKAMESSLLD